MGMAIALIVVSIIFGISISQYNKNEVIFEEQRKEQEKKVAGYDHNADRVWIKFKSCYLHTSDEEYGKVLYDAKSGKYYSFEYGTKLNMPCPNLLKDRPDIAGMPPEEIVDKLYDETAEREKVAKDICRPFIEDFKGEVLKFNLEDLTDEVVWAILDYFRCYSFKMPIASQNFENFYELYSDKSTRRHKEFELQQLFDEFKLSIIM